MDIRQNLATELSPSLKKIGAQAYNRAHQTPAPRPEGEARVRTRTTDQVDLSGGEQRTDLRDVHSSIRELSEIATSTALADGTLRQMGEVLQDMRSLMVEVEGLGFEQIDREPIQGSLEQLRSTLERFAQETRFRMSRLFTPPSEVPQASEASQPSEERPEKDAERQLAQVEAATAQAQAQSAMPRPYQPAQALTPDQLGTPGLKLSQISVTRPDFDAKAAIGSIDAAIRTIEVERGRVGQVRSQIAGAVERLGSQSEVIPARRDIVKSVAAAIGEADVARQSIRQAQASTMRAQANTPVRTAVALLD